MEGRKTEIFDYFIYKVMISGQLDIVHMLTCAKLAYDWGGNPQAPTQVREIIPIYCNNDMIFLAMLSNIACYCLLEPIYLANYFLMMGRCLTHTI
jgi:hypothetical protein